MVVVGVTVTVKLATMIGLGLPAGSNAMALTCSLAPTVCEGAGAAGTSAAGVAVGSVAVGVPKLK